MNNVSDQEVGISVPQDLPTSTFLCILRACVFVQVISYPIGSVCMVYMVCNVPSIYPSHVSYIPWIRHGYVHPVHPFPSFSPFFFDAKKHRGRSRNRVVPPSPIAHRAASGSRCYTDSCSAKRESLQVMQFLRGNSVGLIAYLKWKHMETI